VIRELVPIALATLLASCTCNEVKEPGPSQSNLVAASSSAKPAVDLGPEPDVDLDSIPVKEDYELDAEKAITPKTLLEKVDELEKEVSKK
jgi:hypothetical protein